MDNDRDLRGLIASVVKEETRWLRHYIGQVQVNVDPLVRGRVSATIPELGLLTPEEALWCYPRQGYSMNVPKINDYVEIYFMAGDPNRPVYMAIASEVTGMDVSSFNGLASDRVIFESPVTGENIKYDDILRRLTFLEGTEAFVKGDELKTQLQTVFDALTQLQLDFGAWVVVPLDGGGALKTAVTAGFLTKTIGTLANILSTTIKGK